MYACVTDYDAIYNDAYRHRRGEATSFDRSVLPALIAEFGREVGCRRILDVGGGQGNLARDLAAFGMDGTTLDYGAPPGADIMPFNLGRHQPSAVEAVLRHLSPERGDYLTTCFDVLEHIDREHVADALQNLASLTRRYLLVSISTRPSIQDNLLHPTLAPIRTWVRAFAAAGFALRDARPFSAASSVRRHEVSLIQRWVTADMFGDAGDPEPRYLILERTGPVPSFEDAKAAIDLLFDVAFRHIKRAQWPRVEDRINFQVHHPQCWSLIRPFLDVVPRDRARFLIRPWDGYSDTYRAVRAILRRNGIATVEFDRADDLPWADLKGEVLVSAADNSVGFTHLVSYETVAAARLHGCRTYLLQHGIWPRAFDRRIITFASERVLTWGRSEEAILNGRRHKFLEADVPWGILPREQTVPIGSPKFSDALIGPHPGLDALFGIESGAFRRAVLVGTKAVKQRWGIENFDDRFVQELGELTTRYQDTLFIIRPHPADTALTFAHLKATNVRLFDEAAANLSDVALSRVLPGIDLLVTSPSSLIMDGAVAGKPIFVYATEQPVEYEHVEAHSFASLGQVLGSDGGPHHSTVNNARFMARYGEAINDRFFETFARRLEDDDCGAIDRYLAASATLAGIANELQAALRECQTALAAAETRAGIANELQATLAAAETRAGEDARQARQKIEFYEADLADKAARLIALDDRLRSAEAETTAIRASTSWRLTAPFRRVVHELRQKLR